MFVNAGMVPFKPYFLGEAPPLWQRATSIQKCVRTLDIDEVGRTTRHNTFFQMAGNFSFGDYFKEGAIRLAWDLITGSVENGGYALDPERLWATVYQDDDEALELWRSIPGLPLLGDLLRPRSAVRSRRRSRGGRGPVPGDLEPGVHAGHPWRREPQAGRSDHRVAAGEEHRHRHGCRAGGDRAAGRGERLRDRPAAQRDHQGRADVRPPLRRGQDRRH